MHMIAPPQKLPIYETITFRSVTVAASLCALFISASGVLAPASAKPRRSHDRAVTMAAKSPAAGSLTSPAVTQSDAQATGVRLLDRAQILASDPERLARIGRHLMIGYHSYAQVKALVEHRAIAGVFITDHNVKGRTPAAVKADIDALQAIRLAQGLPPLIIAADQEGGAVSRLSPPLKRQKSLAEMLKGVEHDVERRKIVEAFAETQAAELKKLGVTLNFAPVVDLNLNPKNTRDGETRLRMRAIGSDPFLVAKVAGWYCDAIAASGIMCTLKHFPGLGRVTRDTHVTTGEITASEGQLELNDWVPFRRVMHKPNAVTMLGHVRVGVIDKTTPASYSKPVIDTLIRKTWRYDGLLITDDFSMGAITRGKPGVGRAAVQALNAGVDIVLVSYMEKHLDSVMSVLLAADQNGEFDAATRTRSRERIARIVSIGEAPPEAAVPACVKIEGSAAHCD
jgi:beta-N-acetylhexosaminidase